MGKKIQRIICYILAVLIFLFGVIIYFYPMINRSLTTHNNQENLEIFREMRVEKTTEQQPNTEKTDTTAPQDPAQTKPSANNSDEKNAGKQYAELYNDMKSYNERIYDEGQRNLRDAWSYEQSEFYLGNYGLYNGIVAELRIPKINCDVPLYLGATMGNMAYGAAQLGETSMPIGGINTNCVIAAHRGASTGEFFLYIEDLKKGDKVYIDNLWETLTYRVSRIEVISPDDIEKILIEDNKDMITLITCHPYPYNYQRYAVFCERYKSESSGSESGEADTSEETSEQSGSFENGMSTGAVTPTESAVPEVENSAKGFIEFENTLYAIVPIILAIAGIILALFPLLRRKIKPQKE